MKSKIAISLMVSFLLSIGMVFAAKEKKLEDSKNKAGAINMTLSGGSYKLKTSTDNGSGTTAVKGMVLFYERLITKRFSVGLSYSSFLERTMEFDVGSSTNTILETGSMFTIDFKSYFKSHIRTGFKPYVGVGFGTVTLSSKVTTDTSGTESEGTTGASIPITALSIGADYLVDFGGVRADLSIITGGRDDTSGHDTYNATYTLTGTSFGIAVFGFF